MSAFAKRRTDAAHKRPVPAPDGSPSETDLGTIRIHSPVEAPVAFEGEIDVSAPTAEMTIAYDPEDDVQNGDLLIFDGETHEVRTTRTFDGKRTDYAEADVVRKEVPL